MVRSKSAMYAALAVIEVARRRPEDAGLQAREFSQLFNIPRSYAAKVLTRLTRAGILRSARGPRGGYHLGRGASEISFLEVIETFAGVLSAEPRVQHLDGREHVQAGMNDLFDRCIHQLREYLRASTVADFIRTTRVAELTAGASKGCDTIHAGLG